MSEIIYQNPDDPQNNPISSSDVKINPKKIKLPPLTPKLIALIILFAIIFILFIISLFINQKTPSVPTIPTPTPIPVVKVTPQPQIPTQYQSQFNQIDELLNQQDIVAPPTVDQDLGL
jgi:hypothetical protein